MRPRVGSRQGRGDAEYGNLLQLFGGNLAPGPQPPCKQERGGVSAFVLDPQTSVSRRSGGFIAPTSMFNHPKFWEYLGRNAVSRQSAGRGGANGDY